MATRLYDVITQNSLSTDQKSHIRYLPSRSHIYPQDVWLIHMSYRKSAEMFASKEENLRTLLIFLLFLGSRLLSLVTLCLLRIGCIFFFEYLISLALLTWPCLCKLFLSMGILKTPLAIVSKVDNECATQFTEEFCFVMLSIQRAMHNRITRWLIDDLTVLFQM
jgi:hypothetical protein